MSLTLNIDLDGTIYDFHSFFTDYVSLKKFKYNLRYMDPTTWEFWEEWGMSYGEWQGWFRRGVEEREIWWKGDEIRGAAKNLWKLSDLGCTIRICTYRLVHKFNHAASIEATVSWLDEHNIPYHDISFLSHRTSKNDIRADVSLDDNAKYLPSGLNAESRKGILFARPWNKDDWNNYEIVNTWDDFYERIEELAKR
jgi:hypothetical protein